jgi:hypothetical protein
MRTVVGTLICLSGFASLACAASESTAPLPTYHLHGYYSIREENAVWQYSDNTPWQVVANEPWIDPKVVKWGYVPLVHDSKHYYCLIDEKPITGSNIAKKTFICGDAGIVKFGYANEWRPTLRLYGPDHY